MLWVIVGLWALGFVLLWRIPICPASSGQPPPAISVIIPARNEESNLRPLLESLQRQTTPAVEVIVVDDQSTDRTADLARELDAAVVASEDLPDGWRGKTWACQQGARAAQGDLFLFIDADTRLEADALERLGAAFSQHGRAAVSLGPYHDVVRPYEQFSAIFNLLTFMGMGSFSAYGSPDAPDGLFGPCLLIDRVAYERIGGHESVKGEILEHMSMCQLLRVKDVPMLCLGGREVIHTRMYPHGFASLIEGWTKAFAAGASKTNPLTLILTIAWMTGGMLAFILSALAPVLSPAFYMYLLPYAAYAVEIYRMLRRIGSFRAWSALLYPLLLISFFIIFFRSALLKKRGKAVTWKGRSMPASESGGSA